ncbi:hypothetical protein IMX26_07410 [Clostridium sp. 'deep sea']|uniref:hypothetical protein n=1 Tax=Clostridium sp. 'deep sea' TaxID=2779445 RepID=UPI0018965B6D|nr:hypothetical protein [Clostridium sp. 'deep sea']QOR36625.1 hypothetical protein IMX26_07410 [Clostridium sp. 'deep sea']
MKAILWKKYLNIKKNKVKTLLFLLMPIVYFILNTIKEININTTIAYFPFICTLLSNLCNWSLEDLVYTEVILTSKINIKSIWKANHLFIAIAGYCYSLTVLFIAVITSSILYNNVHGISVLAVLMCFFFVLADIAILANSTVHYSDFSKLKQIYSSIFGIASIALPTLFLFKTQYFAVNPLYFSGIVGGSIILLYVANLIVNTTNNESLIINMQKLQIGYINSVILE